LTTDADVAGQNEARTRALFASLRVRLTNNDRWFFIQLYRWFPSILQGAFA
jgi:hypothetical protein